MMTHRIARGVGRDATAVVWGWLVTTGVWSLATPHATKGDAGTLRAFVRLHMPGAAAASAAGALASLALSCADWDRVALLLRAKSGRELLHESDRLREGLVRETG